jgi:hypothetical protein
MKFYQRLQKNARMNMKKNPLAFAIGVAAVLYGAACLILQIIVWAA